MCILVGVATAISIVGISSTRIIAVGFSFLCVSGVGFIVFLGG